MSRSSKASVEDGNNVCFDHETENVDKEVSEERFPEEVNRYEGVEARTKVPSRKTNDASHKGEIIHQLYKSRSGQIGVLAEAYNNIQRLIVNEQGNVGDISLKFESFAEAWCKFVDVHENYLDLLENESNKQNACTSYEEQI